MRKTLFWFEKNAMTQIDYVLTHDSHLFVCIFVYFKTIKYCIQFFSFIFHRRGGGCMICKKYFTYQMYNAEKREIRELASKNTLFNSTA